MHLSACHSQWFEPYVLVARSRVPLYDERFRGYFRNKALQLQHMASLGLPWVVHRDFFVVHYPHESSGIPQLIMQAGIHKQARDAASSSFPWPQSIALLHFQSSDLASASKASVTQTQQGHDRSPL